MVGYTAPGIWRNQGTVMRFVVWLAGVAGAAVLGWCGWWYAAAAGQEQALEAWLEDRRADGWLAEVSALDIAGFPTRFERRMEAPQLSDPNAGWAWQAPSLELGSDAWDPTHITIDFPPTQSVAVPAGRASVRASRMQAVAAVVPSLSLRLREIALDAEALAIEGREGWRAGADTLDASLIRRVEDSAPENTYDLRLGAEALVLPDRLASVLTPAGGEVTDGSLAVRGVIVTDRPIDRTVIDKGEIGAETIIIRQTRLSYGGAIFDVKGRLDADDRGYAEGDLEVSARDWRRVLKALVASGTVGEGTASAIRNALQFVSLFAGDDLDLPLTFADGRVGIGPVTIGDAPRLMKR